ncbi:DUF6415 family natural product biosynthesis protein [Streptomyces sp. NPDC086766]|uniref:DUF6415 family natural product biosynthesis protein n=1 Tax=Streptomyces sp. NPDC086766 TaxID=3365754 RepID=UPI0038168986
MRDSIRRLLGPHAGIPETQELAVLTGVLRGHIESITPRIEQAALKLPADDVPRYCALACVGEARRKLTTTASPGPSAAVAYARRLARSLAALCDHWETLAGVVMCLACDQPIRDSEASMPYDHISPSGGTALSGTLHTRCAHTIRRH